MALTTRLPTARRKRSGVDICNAVSLDAEAHVALQGKAFEIIGDLDKTIAPANQIGRSRAKGRLAIQTEAREMRVLEAIGKGRVGRQHFTTNVFCVRRSAQTGAGEHVIPKWLQREFSLFN